MLTQNRLKHLLSYCPSSGEFACAISGSGRGKIGEIAGTIGHKGYRAIKIDGKSYQAHRLVWLYVHGKFPRDQIDHINGIRDDNRLENLRDANSADNARNRKVPVTSKSGIMGVSWRKRDKCWVAQMQVADKNMHLGQSKDLSLVIWYREMAEQRFGFHQNNGRS